MADEDVEDRLQVGEAALTEAGADPETVAAEMPFLDHLEELRWRIIKTLTAIFAGAAVAFFFADIILTTLAHPYQEAVLSRSESGHEGPVEAMRQLVESWLGDPASIVESGDRLDEEGVAQSLPPSRRLQAIKPMTYFFVQLQVALLGGVVISLPVIFFQFWQFVAPGLLTREKGLVFPLIGLSVLCFAIGACIAYWIVLPLGLRFFLSLEPADMTSQWAVNEYFGFVLRLLFGFGIVFEMPVVTLFLSRIGLITPDTMRRVRRYAVVSIFLVAAIFTPPDPVSQILMALPLLLLYELSIWVCRVSARKRRSDQTQELTKE